MTTLNEENIPISEKSERFRVLLVEDNPSDAYWMKLMLAELGVECPVTVATDGEEALDYLLKRGRHADAPAFDLIFLDINIPKVSGVEVLEALQGEQEYPICIVSGSTYERQCLGSPFKMDPRRYAVKPVNPSAILEALECFAHLRPIAEEIRSSLPQVVKTCTTGLVWA
jgi:CheY-like chemotaxis protein